MQKGQARQCKALNRKNYYDWEPFPACERGRNDT